jgi:hypothetical protein
MRPDARGADDRRSATGPAQLADMRIGDLVAYAGRQYVVRGLDPMGVPERRADLEDAETGEIVRVPIAALAAAPDSSS